MSFSNSILKQKALDRWIASIRSFDIIGIFVVLCFYNILQTIYKRLPDTPFLILEKIGESSFGKFQDIYETWSFSLFSFNSLSFIGLILVPVAVLSVYRWKFHFNDSLESDDLYKATRIFIMSVAGFIAWYMALSPYNYYFDELFLIDRFIIVALFVIMFWYIEASYLLVVFSLLFLWQYDIPLGQNSTADKKIVYEILILFSSFLFVRPWFQLRLSSLWLLFLCIIGSNYFIPAFEKMSIGPTWYSWIVDNNFGYHFLASYLQEWNPFNISYDRALFVSNWVAKYSPYLQFMAFALEIMGLVLLAGRKWAILIILSFCLFHVGVFLESGIFFWKWLLFNAIIAFLLIKYKQEFLEVFNWRYKLLSVLIIFFSKSFFAPVELGWWDYPTRPNIYYEATTKEGEVKKLSGNQFRPYDQVFSFQRLYHLFDNDSPVYVPNYSSYSEAMAVRSMSDSVFNSLMLNHKPYFNQAKKKKTEELLHNFIRFYNNKNDFWYSFITAVKAPEHIWGVKFADNLLSHDDQIESIRIYFDQHKYENLNPRLISKRLLLEVKGE